MRSEINGEREKERESVCGDKMNRGESVRETKIFSDLPALRERERGLGRFLSNLFGLTDSVVLFSFPNPSARPL